MITTWEQHDEIQDLVFVARDRIENCEGPSGTHFQLMHLLKKYGITAMTREDTVVLGQRACDEFIAAQLAEAE